MITDLFLNSCFSLVFSNHGKVKKEVFRDILYIISFVEKKDKLDIPVVVKNKTECLKEICKLKLDDKNNYKTRLNIPFSLDALRNSAVF